MADYIDSLLALEDLSPIEEMGGEIESLPTQVRDLDAILGGGIPVGKITEIFGAEDSCKSAIGYNLLKSTIDRDGLAVLIDTEDRYSIDWWKQWGLFAQKEFLGEFPIASPAKLPRKIKESIPLLEREDLLKVISEHVNPEGYLITSIKRNRWVISKGGIGGQTFSLLSDGEKLSLFKSPNLKLLMPNRFETSLDFIGKLFEIALDHGDTYTTIVLDSFEGVPAKAEADANMNDLLKTQRAVKTNIFARAIGKLNAMYNEYKIENKKNSKLTFIVINHAKYDMSTGKSVSTGGRMFKHSQFCRILTERGTNIDPSEKSPPGFFVHAKVERNKAAPIAEGLKVTFKFFQPSKELSIPAHFEPFDSRLNKSARGKLPLEIREKFDLV